MVATAEAPPQLNSRERSPLWVRWRSSPDAWPVAFLSVLPVLVFVVPAMTGHPAISWDNLIQNFPLRVEVGALLRHGHLPLWNPTIWSGSPLLAGLNAGAFYPTTMLFVFLPAVGAWVLNLLIVYWAAGLGMYALLRQYRLRPLACLLAGVTYQFGGAMTGQLVHLGIVQGMAWMPLLVLAELRLSWSLLGTGPLDAYGGPHRRGSWVPWLTLLAVLVGLIFLTGEPRSMAEAEVVAPIVLVWLALRSYPGAAVGARRRVLLVGAGVLAAAWGALIGASQLLPGKSFIVASQRATESYSYFGSGSLRPAWTIMLLVQNIVGGNGVLNQPAFSASYNLPEVTGYMGLLPLVAFFALAVRALGKRADPRAREWRLWLFLGPLGLLMAIGTYTVFGHVFALIPFYNKVRLDSRSLNVVDLALAVCFGFWVELFLAGEWRERVRRPWRWLREVLAPYAAPVAALLTTFVAIVVPISVVTALGGVELNAGATRLWMAAQGVVALGAIAVVWAWRRWPAEARRRLVVAVVAADLGLFALSCSTGMFAGGQVEPSRAEAAALVGTTGRFAIVESPSITVLTPLSEPDMNALTGLDSVQGYGSIVAGSYGTVTGTHNRSSMDPCALARGVFVPLRLATLFIEWPSLVTGVAPDAAPAPVPSCPGAPPAGTASTRTFYLGAAFPILSVHLRMTSRSAAPPHLGIVDAAGTATSFPASTARVAGTGWIVTFERPVQASALVVVGHAASVEETSTFFTVQDDAYELNGGFQQPLGQTAWRLTGFAVGYARFRTDHLGPQLAVTGAPGATVRRLRQNANGGETDLVAAPGPVTVVRSEAYLSGWRVVARPAQGGRARTLAVFASGLLQAVRVPAGRWLITFSYWPSGLTVGGIASAAGVVAALGAATSGLWWSRRRARRAR